MVMIAVLKESTHNLAQVLGLGVTNSDSRMLPLQELRDWRADNTAAPQYDHVLAGNGHARALDQLNTAGRCAGNEAGEITHCDATLVYCVQTGRREGNIYLEMVNIA